MTPGVVWQIHVHTGTYPAALAAEKRYIDGTSVVVMVATAAAAAAGVMVQEGLDWETGHVMHGDEWTRRVEPKAGNWLLGIPPTIYPTALALATPRQRKITQRGAQT